MPTFWTTADLKARGKTDRAIAAAASDGRLLPVRTGWWATPGTPDDLVRAVRDGGAATAHTAARARGLWTPPDPRPADYRRGDAVPMQLLHVAVRRTTTAARLLDPDDATRALGERSGVIVVWTSPDVVRESRHQGLVPVLPMLRDVFRAEEEPERALAVVDSALRQRFLRQGDLPALEAMLPGRLAHVPSQADPRAQSGTETILRFRLRARGLKVEPQARVSGMGQGDVLVEGRVLVEVDGREWHDDEERFEEDRRRDLVATLGRYRVLRFSWYQVLFRWSEVEAAILAVLAM